MGRTGRRGRASGVRGSAPAAWAVRSVPPIHEFSSDVGHRPDTPRSSLVALSGHPAPVKHHARTVVGKKAEWSEPLRDGPATARKPLQGREGILQAEVRATVACATFVARVQRGRGRSAGWGPGRRHSGGRFAHPETFSGGCAQQWKTGEKTPGRGVPMSLSISRSNWMVSADSFRNCPAVRRHSKRTAPRSRRGRGIPAEVPYSSTRAGAGARNSGVSAGVSRCSVRRTPSR